jgi:PiT family inorganic phosphate transporter
MVSLLIAVIIAALIFDYINGFHDTANAISTCVATGVLSLGAAVIVAAIFNFAGAMAGTAVAKTIASGFADPTIVTQTVVLSALIGASAWNLITWWFGIPSSSSHALIGGLAGAVVAQAGVGAFNWSTLGLKVLIPLVVSPILGFAVAFLLIISAYWIAHGIRPGAVNQVSRRLQLLSACAFAFSHGSNDAQKSMGVITLALVAFAAVNPQVLPAWVFDPAQGAKHVPFWVVLSCALAMALGTMAGGKRIIKTMGSKIIRIVPIQGFAAECGGTTTILLASQMGIPVSTTHCISAAIMGAGASKRLSAVRWNVAFNIVIAWVLTIPASAIIAALSLWALRPLFG